MHIRSDSGTMPVSPIFSVAGPVLFANSGNRSMTLYSTSEWNETVVS